jgi:hypothetical protein
LPLSRLLPGFALLLALPAAATPDPGPGCTFSSGTTTCVIVSTAEHHQQITMVSGCNYGPQGTPGRRERVFDQTVLITATTTTYAHGLRGPVYDHDTTVTSQITSSTLISDTCYPL